MIKLHVPLWELLWRGTALYLVAHFMIRGHMFKRRLQRESIARGKRGGDQTEPA
jgi:hypothetical protein